jgi:hypothetical protein
VRAFGCLLEELLERVEANETESTVAQIKSQQVKSMMEKLRDRCLSHDLKQRPRFTEIKSILLKSE